MSQSKTLTPDNLEKLIDWAFQTLISWSVILLTCFVGLIELLPEIKLHSGLGQWLTVFLCLIYLILVSGLYYSLYRIGTLYGEIVNLQNSLPERMKKKIHRAPHIPLILDKEGNPKRKAIIFLAILISALWILVLVFKILISLN